MKARLGKIILKKVCGTVAAGSAGLLFICALAQAENYAMRGALETTTFTLTKVYPQVFSPNGDRRNDHAEFQFENPRDANPVGKIYDLYGAVVAELKKGDAYDALVWDGTTTSGSIAPPGVYVYQIEVTGSESKVISGVIVLAK